MYGPRQSGKSRMIDRNLLTAGSEATDERTPRDIIDDSVREAMEADNRRVLDEVQELVLSGVSIHDLVLLPNMGTVNGKRVVTRAAYEIVKDQIGAMI